MSCFYKVSISNLNVHKCSHKSLTTPKQRCISLYTKHCIKTKLQRKHFRPRALNKFYTTNGIRGVILLTNDDWIVRNMNFDIL